MRTLSLAFMGAIFVAGAVVATGTTTTINAQKKMSAVEHGKMVYATAKCKTCHSIDGVGAKKGPLDAVGSKLSEAEIREWIVNAPEMAKKAKTTRKPVMKSYKLSKDDLDGLVAYMASLTKPLK